jgi:mercuric ion transport protein
MTHKNIILLFLISLFFVACDSKTPKTEVMTVKASNLVKETVPVKGMTCVGCETRLEKAIVKMEGVVTFKASSQNNSATLEFDKSKTDLKTVQNALTKLSANACL